MKGRTIYTAVGVKEYVGSWPFRAFVAQRDAEAFVAACNAYPRFGLKYPTLDMPDDEFDAKEKAWIKAKAYWESRHPAGKGYAEYHEYIVGRMKLFDASLPSQ